MYETSQIDVSYPAPADAAPSGNPPAPGAAPDLSPEAKAKAAVEAYLAKDAKPAKAAETKPAAAESKPEVKLPAAPTPEETTANSEHAYVLEIPEGIPASVVDDDAVAILDGFNEFALDAQMPRSQAESLFETY